MVVKEDIKKDAVFTDSLGRFKVMAVADGYAMCRRSRAMPFVLRLHDLIRRVSIIKDEMGTTWSSICPECKMDALHIVRPGKLQCGNCE